MGEGRLPVETVVWLVNEWGTKPRLRAGESIAPYPGPAEVRRRLGREPADGELARVADRLYPAFAARSPAELASRLEGLAVEARLAPRFQASATGVAVVLDPPAGVDDLFATAVAAVARHVSTHGPQALGTCAGEDCVDAWLHLARGRPRRFCSERCAGRARVRAHRARSPRG